jgi:VIT1/CCC1 family predicted Fe2+/Mn2+ transporter
MAAFTGNSILRGGWRMFVIGAIAAAVTFGIGSAIGVTLD